MQKKKHFHFCPQRNGGGGDKPKVFKVSIQGTVQPEMKTFLSNNGESAQRWSLSSGLGGFLAVLSKGKNKETRERDSKDEECEKT